MEGVIDAVIVVAVSRIGRPHVLHAPVVEGIAGIGAIRIVCCPRQSFVGVLVSVDGATAVEALLGADADQTDGSALAAAFVAAVPVAEVFVNLLLRDAVVVEVEGMVVQVDDAGIIRHRACPQLALVLLPRIPILLELAGGGLASHRQAQPIGAHQMPQRVSGQGTGHIIRGCSVLRLEILVHDGDRFADAVRLHVVQAEVEQQAAVLAAGERHIDVVEFGEYGAQALLRRLVHVDSQGFHNFSSSLRARARSSRKRLAKWRAMCSLLSTASRIRSSMELLMSRSV